MFGVGWRALAKPNNVTLSAIAPEKARNKGEASASESRNSQFIAGSYVNYHCELVLN